MMLLDDYPNLATKRLLMRPMTIADSEVVVQWRNSFHVRSMNRNDQLLDIDTHRDWFLSTRDKRVDYIVALLETGQPIGSTSFTLQKNDSGELWGELGKYIGEKGALGKGFAFEFSLEWIRFGFQVLGIDMIFSQTRKTNLPNIHINQKLGFEIVPFLYKGQQISDEWMFMRMMRNYWLNELSK